ncbi:hypothetical protein HY570_00550 [Candidatus Micrarchaeota archaeon]|nr:hypothetical protein [Candidatus Micrarchaeota archaeon]
MTRKGQILSLDALFATIILISLLIVFNNSWILLTAQAETNPSATTDAQMVLDRFILNPGYPETWNDGNVQLIGLSDPPGVLQESKLRELLDFNASEIQNRTGVTKYNLYFNITYTNGTAIRVARNVTLLGIPLPVEIENETVFGTYPTINSSEAAYARGVTWYKDNRTIVNVILWR